MKTLILGAAAALFTWPAAAQQQPQQEDRVERDVQRMKDSLRLTDDQVGKVREILKRNQQDVRGVLTDEQKKTYDEGGRGGRGGAPGGNTPGGTRGGTRIGGLPSTQELKTQLSLTEDQVTKINAVQEAQREQFRNALRPGGTPGEARPNFDQIREESTKKIRDLLTEAQKPKFDELVAAARNRQPTPGGTGGFGRPRGTPAERSAEIVTGLKIADAKEAEAVRTVIMKVLELMDKLDTHQRESRTKIDEATRNVDLSDQAIAGRIEEIRTGLKQIEKDLSAARRELAGIVTSRQELDLLRRGILR